MLHIAKVHKGGSATGGLIEQRNNSGWQEVVGTVVEHSGCEILHDGFCFLVKVTHHGV